VAGRWWGRSPARRLQLDPTPVARVVTGAVLVVFVTGWLMAFLPLLARASSNPYHELAAAVRPGTILIQSGADAGVASRISRVSGVRGRPRPADQRKDSRHGHRRPECVDRRCGLRRLERRAASPAAMLRRRARLLRDLRWIRARTRAGRPSHAGALAAEVGGGRPRLCRTPIRVPVGLLPVARAQELSQLGVQGELALAPAAIPPEALAQNGAVLIGTDGRADTVERVRTAAQAGRGSSTWRHRRI